MSPSAHSQNTSSRPNPIDDTVMARPADGTAAAEAWLAATVLIAALAVLSLGALSWIV
jgi:hypothetical protein